MITKTSALIIYVIPRGPDRLCVITGYLLIGGLVVIFIDWKLGILLILGALIVAKFRIWSRRVNYDCMRNESNTKSKNNDNLL